LWTEKDVWPKLIYGCRKSYSITTFILQTMYRWHVNCTADLDGSLMAPTVDKTLSYPKRLAAVKSVLQATEQRRADSRMATIFDAKEQYKVLCQCCAVALSTRCVDPKVACWLLDPASSEKNLHCLVTNYCPLEVSLLQGQRFFFSYTLLLSVVFNQQGFMELLVTVWFTVSMLVLISMTGPFSTRISDLLRAGKPSRYVTSHPGQLSLPIFLW